MVKDPVCGMEINEKVARSETGRTAHGAVEVDPQQGTRRFHNGKWYYFCGLECRNKFMAAPDKYTQGAR